MIDWGEDQEWVVVGIASTLLSIMINSVMPAILVETINAVIQDTEAVSAFIQDTETINAVMW